MCHAADIYQIRHARFPADAFDVLAIWKEYIASPSVSLDYQGYESEFLDLPGKYAAPAGCLLLGELDGHIVACAGLRKVSASICEIKRLYFRPGARGTGLGRDLVKRLIQDAKQAGYLEIRLDVLAEIEAAQRLYESFGFEPAEPVSHNPTPGARFLGLRID